LVEPKSKKITGFTIMRNSNKKEEGHYKQKKQMVDFINQITIDKK
jgi:hypothetical protein